MFTKVTINITWPEMLYILHCQDLQFKLITTLELTGPAKWCIKGSVCLFNLSRDSVSTNQSKAFLLIM